jgi:hypothetical protein
MKDWQSYGSYLQHRILSREECDGGSFRLAKDLGDDNPLSIARPSIAFGTACCKITA